MHPLPHFTSAERKAIRAVLPAAQKAKRLDYLDIVLALVVQEAHGISIRDAAPIVGVSASTVRVLRSRWNRDGSLPAIMEASQPAIDRMRAERCRRLVPNAGRDFLAELDAAIPGGLEGSAYRLFPSNRGR